MNKPPQHSHQKLGLQLLASLALILSSGCSGLPPTTMTINSLPPIEETTSVNIGLVLDVQSVRSGRELQDASMTTTTIQVPPIKLNTMQVAENPVEMSQLGCERLLGGNASGALQAVLVETGAGQETSVAALSFTLALYNVPLVASSLRDSSLANRNLHSSYLSLAPPHSHQADVWFALLKRLRFSRAVVVAASEGAEELLARLVDLALQRRQEFELRLEAIEEFERGAHRNSEEARHQLGQRISQLLATSNCRVYLLHAQSPTDVKLFIELIRELHMNQDGFAIIISEQTWQVAHDAQIELPPGLIWSRLVAGDMEAYLSDSLELVARSLRELAATNLLSSAGSLQDERRPRGGWCHQDPADADQGTGLALYQSMLGQRFQGRTGLVAFNQQGHRQASTYQLLNSRSIGDNKEAVIGHFRSELDQVEVEEARIEWPGGLSGHLISGLYVKRHLRVTSLVERPFVMALEDESCWTTTNSTTKGVPCRRAGKPDSQLCCVGYCMELLAELARRLGLSYEVELVADNQYGHAEPSVASLHHHQQQRRPQPPVDGGETGGESWTGLMGELVSGRADLAVAPLTITPRRLAVADFSKPFKFHGFSILLRRGKSHTPLASFLQPFHNHLWLLVIGLATHVVAFTLYLLDRYSTLGKFGLKRGYVRQDHEHPLHLSSSLWFSWSILLNSGVGEHTPRSLSGRVLGIFWAGFAMIVVASYTANLAAFLVLDSREEGAPGLAGIDDPRLRSGDLQLQLATVRGSAADTFLQSQVEFVNLYRKMEEFQFQTVDEAIEALRSGSIDALIWDSTRLEWEVARDPGCTLAIAGELFGSTGYGLGLPKDSPWTRNITTQLLELHEAGFMAQLDRRWVLATGACQGRPDDKPDTLGVHNIAGVFILFAVGLITSLALILGERLLARHRKRIAENLRRSLGRGRRGGRQERPEAAETAT